MSDSLSFSDTLSPETHTHDQADTGVIGVSCATGRGVYPDYWKHLSVYELSAQDLDTRASKLRQWRETAPESAIFVPRIDPAVISEMFSDQRGISSQSEAAIARALTRVEALRAPVLLLHTPSSVRPSQAHERAVIKLRERLPADLPLIWRADGLWEDSESYFELCAAHEITPVIDPIMWDEDESLPTGARAYWRVMGGAGLSPKLSEYELDKLLNLADQWLSERSSDHREAHPAATPQLWVHFSSHHMFSAARRWRASI